MIISLNSYNPTDEHMLINDYDVIHTVSGTMLYDTYIESVT